MSESGYLVSAIVSVYNCERFIEGCLQDLEDQTIASTVEIIVVNSCSQQNEDAVIKRFQERFDNIVYIKTEDRETIYKAWNRGIKIATGKYITNANSDDRHRKDAFEIMVGTLENNMDIDLVYGDCIVSNIENETFESCKSNEYRRFPDVFDRSSILLNGSIGHQPMWRRHIHDVLGYFDETLEIAGDFEFWLRISEKVKLQHIRHILGLYYWNPNSAERRIYELRQIEVISVFNKYMPDLSANPYVLKKVKYEISRLYEDCANYYLMNDKLLLSRRSSIKGIKSNLSNIKNYYFLIATFLPKYFVNILKTLRRI